MNDKITDITNEHNLQDNPAAPGNKHRTLAVTMQRRKWSILIITVLCVASAVGYIIKATPIYTSTARLLVEQKGPKIISDYEGVMTQSKNYLYTQGEIIKSSTILSKVLQRNDIKNLRTFTDIKPALLEMFKDKIGILPASLNSGHIDNKLMYFGKIIDVQIGLKDDIIAVSCKSPYRQEAAVIVNAIIEEYIEHNAGAKKNTVSEVLKILQKDKIQRDKELNDNYTQMLDFTKKYGVVSADTGGANAVFVRLKNLSDSLSKAELETIDAKSLLQAAESLAAEPERLKQFALSMPNTGASVFANDMEKTLRMELKEARTELQNVLLQCSQDHPTVIALKKKITQFQQQLTELTQEFADSFITALEIKYQTAKQKEDALKSSYQSQLEDAQSINVKATEYAILESKLEQSKRFCEILDNRIKELNVSEDVGALNISILEAARPAEFASSPQKAKIVAASLLIGLIFSVSIAMLREWRDWRMKSAEEISQTIGTPVLGIVPSFTAKGKDQKSARGQCVHNVPKSTAAEAYRTIRTSVFFGVPKGQARTILITSPSPGDGKTTMVSNLAIAIAQAGQKTLVIDADFRKPMQHKIFGFANEVEKGLSSILCGQNEIDDALRACPTDGLYLLTSGPDIPNPSELLNSTAFENLLKELTHRFDRIIIDSPPVTAVADAQILAAICDITILVLRADKSTRKAGQQAKDALACVGANILGAVVNDVAPKHSRSGYYGHYGYYGYGYGNKQNK